MSDNPKRVLLFSGKRKSGKDYITDLLSLRIGSAQSVIIKISGPIKTHWAKTLNLDYNKLIEDGPYKEQYRGEMNKWAEEIRDRDYGYFCREAIDMYNELDRFGRWRLLLCSC
ncbi:probable phosphomevalonate kinase isoform X4 [Cephus cinctus]|uniref:Phosphomevalonate kinase n=1 Tax=Cephus cinctus TaxID=211228 RepID=A0AAJ7BUN2_CEPCN|nr:probable phosphomevalonate kinase isoform X4 [Cephus cinctus]